MYDLHAYAISKAGRLKYVYFVYSPHKAADFGYTVLAAEMKILCLKSSENNLALKLNMEITYRDVVFQFPCKQILLVFHPVRETIYSATLIIHRLI